MAIELMPHPAEIDRRAMSLQGTLESLSISEKSPDCRFGGLPHRPDFEPFDLARDQSLDCRHRGLPLLKSPPLALANAINIQHFGGNPARNVVRQTGIDHQQASP